LERNRVLEEELSQLQGAAWSVITEVLGSRPGSSVLVADLSEVPSEVAGLITDGVFHNASGVLTSVASHYPTWILRQSRGAMPPGCPPTGSTNLDRAWCP
jgi:hypothetical protein